MKLYSSSFKIQLDWKEEEFNFSETGERENNKSKRKLNVKLIVIPFALILFTIET